MACIELQKDPNESIYRKTEEHIRDGNWPSAMNNLTRISYIGVISRLNGKLKDHKLNLPMIQIVSRCIGPVYFIEKAFVNLLRSVLTPLIHFINSMEK